MHIKHRILNEVDTRLKNFKKLPFILWMRCPLFLVLGMMEDNWRNQAIFDCCVCLCPCSGAIDMTLKIVSEAVI